MYIEITSDIGSHVAFSSKSRSISLNDAIQVFSSKLVNEKLIKKNFSVLLYIFLVFTLIQVRGNSNREWRRHSHFYLLPCVVKYGKSASWFLTQKKILYGRLHLNAACCCWGSLLMRVVLICTLLFFSTYIHENTQYKIYARIILL